MDYLLKNLNIVNVSNSAFGDIYIKNGKIAEIGKDLSADEGVVIIDCKGLVAFPGFVDIHTHLREPGLEYKEDIESGSKAAVAGGFTGIACMPNTKPVCDNAAIVSYVKYRSKEVGLCKVFPIGCVSKSQAGAELAEIGKMSKAGAVAISDDGLPVESARFMRLAMEYAGDFGLKVHSHCEDKTLSDGGVVDEGRDSTFAGLKGISRASEEVMVAREIILSQTLNIPVHLCHISTRGSVALIRDAKARGVKVTAETCPHYFAADSSLVRSFDTNTKVNPPLRDKDDVEAIIEGLDDGTIDAIVTDHAPHSFDDKNVEYNLASFGISGLETSFGLVSTVLVGERGFSLKKIASLMSYNPARIINVDGGSICLGVSADITVVDTEERWVVDSKEFYSKGKNTPFNNRQLKGRVKMTFVDGKLCFKDGKICDR